MRTASHNSSTSIEYPVGNAILTVEWAISSDSLVVFQLYRGVSFMDDQETVSIHGHKCIGSVSAVLILYRPY